MSVRRVNLRVHESYVESIKQRKALIEVVEWSQEGEQCKATEAERCIEEMVRLWVRMHTV